MTLRKVKAFLHCVICSFCGSRLCSLYPNDPFNFGGCSIFHHSQINLRLNTQIDTRACTDLCNNPLAPRGFILTPKLGQIQCFRQTQQNLGQQLEGFKTLILTMFRCLDETSGVEGREYKQVQVRVSICLFRLTYQVTKREHFWSILMNTLNYMLNLVELINIFEFLNSNGFQSIGFVLCFSLLYETAYRLSYKFEWSIFCPLNRLHETTLNNGLY